MDDSESSIIDIPDIRQTYAMHEVKAPSRDESFNISQHKDPVSDQEESKQDHHSSEEQD